MKKLFFLVLILLALPIFSAIRVENLSRMVDPMPLGVPVTYNATVTNTEDTIVNYITSVQTATEAKINPSSERTPYLRQYQCLDCGATFVEDERKIHECPKCGSTNIKEGNRVYFGLEGKEDYFKKIEPIPDTNFIMITPRRFTLMPNESRDIQITIEIPKNSKYYNKFYEAILSIEPEVPEKKVANIVRSIRVMDTNGTAHDYFTFKVDGNPDERYIVVSSDVQYNNPIDILSIKIQLDGDWYDVYPIPRLYRGNQMFILKYNKKYSMQIIYQPKGYYGNVDVSTFITYRKYQKFQTGVAGRLWIKTVKDQAQNEAVIKSGKIEFIEPEETKIPENTESPTKTTAPPTIHITPMPQESNRSLWIMVIGVLVILFLVGVYKLI